MSFDPIKFKQAFPLFAQAENQSLVYLDNAATTQKPRTVIEAISEFYLNANGNAHRSSHRLARAATDIITQTRSKAAAFLGAQSPKHIVFTSGATAALNMVAYGLRERLSAGDEIVVSLAEHHANLVPWQVTAKACDADLIFAEIDLSNLQNLVNERTKVIAVTGASNSLGQVVDISILLQLKQLFPKIIIVVDGAQWVCHRSVDVSTGFCDFLVCSAHKFFGPSGIGLLYGNKAALEILSPMMLGGEMIRRVDQHGSEFAEIPERLEAGTSSLGAIAALNACFDFWSRLDRQSMERYEQQLVLILHEYLEALCAQHASLTLLTCAQNNVGIATLVSDGSFSMTDLGLWLDEHNIAVRVGDHCAQPLWRHLEVENSLRISLAAYNTVEDLERLTQGIREFLDHLSAFSSTPFLGQEENNRHLYRECDWQQLTRPQPWQKRYKTLLQWGKQFPSRPSIRQPQYLIDGCEADVWLSVNKQGDVYYFDVDSDSAIVKGLAILLLCRVDGETAAMIHQLDLDDYFVQLQLEKHLSPSRVNGFYRIKQALLNAVDSLP